jgi:hypothetical protein
MEIRRAACRRAVCGTDESGAAHGPHQYVSRSYAGHLDCPGWTPEESVAMLDELDGVLRPWAYGELPPGAVLACHPAIYSAVTRVAVPTYAEYAARTPLLPLPVVLCSELAYGSWQLVLARGQIDPEALVVVRHPVAGGGRGAG